MRWEKLGRIFDPRDHALPHGCREFAQAPQALVGDGFVRIYFSTRSVDAQGGKFRSHIAYVDMAQDFSRVLDVSAHTVLELGGPGCFDEHGIFPMNVLRDGARVLGYTSGVNRRVSVPVDSAIGLVVSDDGGRRFRREGLGPVLGPALHEPCLVADPFVLRRDGAFHMWYIFGTPWRRYPGQAAPERLYRIAHACSRDGREWQREGRWIVEPRLGPTECQALPTVAEIDGRFHMFFCFREATDFRTGAGRGYRIGHAVSDDLARWTRDDATLPLPVTTGEWDSEMQCYPHVFRCGDDVYMLYNGNAFGRHGFGLARLVG